MKNINKSELLPRQTDFAPAERASKAEIQAIHQLVVNQPYLKEVLNAIPLMMLILNSKRQIVAVNQRVIEATETKLLDILGLRPGELVGCVHARTGPNGCGTSVSCGVCGAVNSILKAQSNGRYGSQECHIRKEDGKALDWKVTTSPLNLAGHALQCLTIEDIADTKRRGVLERTFFHDLANTIGAIIGFGRMLADEQEHIDELKEIIRMAEELLEEVQNQQQLAMAESGVLTPQLEAIELKTFLDYTAGLYRKHPVAAGRHIVVESGEVTLRTDARLLRRIMGNMIKNALEAADEGQTVTVYSRDEDHQVTLCVHNSTVMPDNVKLQVFQRSFSTKSGSGRGIGTYSIKLFGEQHLGGRVAFSSEAPHGTVFSITLSK